MSTHAALSHEDLAAYSHELRGALTVIVGYTDLLRRPLDEATRLSALDGIERAVRRADTLCSDALAGRTSSASAGRAFAPVSLSLLAEQVATDQRITTGRTIDVTTHGTARVLGDADAIARALGNLIDNAAKYSLSRASIDVGVAEEEGAAGRLSVVEVADRGPGIPEDQIEHIVRPFARLDRDAGRPGSGLGLTIVTSVVTVHGGQLRILPRDGGGTVMRIELPSS